jgi:hypothetical protein
MRFRLVFADEARHQLVSIEKNPSLRQVHQAVKKVLGLIETNLRHPSLNTHKFLSISGPAGQTAFEAYAQQRTPGAYRIIWCYGPKKEEITILAIIPHP